MADRYRPLYKLDAGGMAEVYVAEAESMAGFKKRVAIKRILPSLIKEERFVRMFLDEARLSLRLNHANIVTVFDIGKSSSTYFIVMEYVEGTNLKFILQYLARRRQTMPLPVAVWILIEVLRGLDYAHDLRGDSGRPLGIVHRDISPPNILLSWNGEVKLTDFGLAKASTQLETTDPGVVKGKFAYLSPEAARGLEVDRRADIFATGIIAFEMLTGQRLFLAETDFATVERVRRADVPSMRSMNPEVPAELEEIVLRSLSREPEERYQRASDFADDLLGFLFSHGLKVSSRDVADLLDDMQRADSTVSATAHAQRTVASNSDPGSNLILRLISDEFEDIRSLDEEEERRSPQPSTPTSGVDHAYDPSAPLRLDDFDAQSETSATESAQQVEPTPAPGSNSSPMQFAPGGETEEEEGFDEVDFGQLAARRRTAATWVLVGLAVALVGGGAYAVLT